MTARRPTRWYIVGEKVLSEVRDNAPDDVKEIFANITRSLEQGPYPVTAHGCQVALLVEFL